MAEANAVLELAAGLSVTAMQATSKRSIFGFIGQVIATASAVPTCIFILHTLGVCWSNAICAWINEVAKPKNSDAKTKMVGANLRRIRNACGLTQEKLAELADVHYRSVQKIESGEMLMRINTLFRLRAALKCSWEDLLGG